MSEQIILSYQENQRKIKIPINYSDLKELFLLAFNEDDKCVFSFKYNDDEGDEIIIEEEDNEFKKKIMEISKINAVVLVEKIEDLEDISINKENESSNSEMKSAMIFKKNDNDTNNDEIKELKEKLEKYEKEKEEILEKSRDLAFKNKDIQKKLNKLQERSKYEREAISEDLKNKYEEEMSKIKQQFLDEKKMRENLESKLKENQSNIDYNQTIQNEIINKDKKIKELNEKLEENKENINNKNNEIEKYKSIIKTYENEIKECKSELEKSKLDIINLKKNNELKEEKKYLEEFLDKKYKEKTNEEILKIKEKLNQKVEEEEQKLKTFYENKYKEKEKKMQEDLNQMSEMINKSNAYLSNISQQFNKNEHKGIKCQRCMKEPIIGIRYKCSECKDYNLCEKCEEDNSINNFHNKEHNFIKIRETKAIKINIVKENKKIYSYDCLNMINLSVFINEGTENAEIKILLKNNGKDKWPEGETKLIFDEASEIKGDDLILEPQDIGEKKMYIANIKNLENMEEGEYKSYLSFNVEGKNYGEKLTLMVIIKKKENEDSLINKYIEKIKEFRDSFNLNEDDYPNEKLLKILQENDFSFEEAFSSLFN